MSSFRKLRKRAASSVENPRANTRLFAPVSCVALLGALFCSATVNFVHADEYLSSWPGIRSSQVDSNDNNFGSWTALTIAPDGSWGAATEINTNRAISRAIAACRKKYKKQLGCGASTRLMRAGWILAFRCGTEYLSVADKDLSTARKNASAREAELQSVYLPDMPSCSLLLTINPLGMVTEASRRQF